MRNLVRRLLVSGVIFALAMGSQTLVVAAAEEATEEAVKTMVEGPETEIAEAESEQPAEVVIYYQPGDAEELVRITEVEYQGCPSAAHVAAVMWTVLNRVDSPLFRENTVHSVIYAGGQFGTCYINHVPRRDDWLEIAQDVLERWNAEKNGLVDPSSSGRVIPPEVIYFKGDGRWNHFRNSAGIEYAIDTEGSPYGY